MKKIYNAPKINVVELKVQAALLQASLEIKNANATSAGMSRDGGSSFFDDDED